MKPVLGAEAREPVRDVARDVLSAPEYSGLDSGAALSEKLTEWLGSVIGDFLTAVGDLPSWAVWLIVLWMVATLIAIFAHAVYTLFLLTGGRRRAARTRERPQGELFGIRDLDFDRIYREAIVARERGDWDRAARHVYAACILWLDRSGWVTFETGKTNHDYAVEIAGLVCGRRPAGGLTGGETAATVFNRLTVAFESIAYGGVAATENAVSRSFEELEVLRRESAPTLAV